MKKNFVQAKILSTQFEIKLRANDKINLEVWHIFLNKSSPYITPK
jgi:translation initiation factor IF-1